MGWLSPGRVGHDRAAAAAMRAAAWPSLEDRTEPGRAEADAAAAPGVAATAPIAFDEADLARACAGAAAAARAAERAALEAERESRIGGLLATLVERLDGVDAVLDERRRQLRAAAATLASAAAAALAPATPGQLAARLAEALVDDCLARLGPDLALTVEVAPELADALAARLDAAPAMRRRPGRLAVEAAPGLEPGELRLVWADGYAEWSSARLENEARAFLERLAEPARERRDARGEKP